MRRLHCDFINEYYLVDRLDCGLPVYFVPKPGFQKKFAVIATNFGSIDNHFKLRGGDERKIPDGVAHFLEHKMFEKEDGDWGRKFSDIGAESNAFTSYTSTQYLFSTSQSDGFRPGLELLLNMVQEPWFSDASVEKEKGIIAQEIKMYNDDPGWRMLINLLGCLYEKLPVNKDIAGSVESIQGITPKLLYECWETFYHPENMALALGGDFENGDAGSLTGILDLVRENFSRRNYKVLGDIQRVLPREPDGVYRKYSEEAMPVVCPKMEIGFKEQAAVLTGREAMKRGIESRLLLQILFGDSSAFYTRHYEEGLIDCDTFSAEYSLHRGAAHSVVGGDTPNPDLLHEAILAELGKAAGNGVIRDNFERTRNAAMGKMISAFNFPDSSCLQIMDSHLLDHEIFDSVDIVRNMKAEDLENRLREHLLPENSAQSRIMPKDGDCEVEEA